MSRRRKRRDHDYRGAYRRESRKFHANKRGGWGMNLYRNTRDGKIAGFAS